MNSVLNIQALILQVFVLQATDMLKRLLSDNSSHRLTDTCLQVLSYIFMDCDGKNPCRRTIARLEGTV